MATEAGAQEQERSLGVWEGGGGLAGEYLQALAVAPGMYGS
jgi:hypothetical protein